MATVRRIYRIVIGEQVRLVRAPTPAQAVNHVARDSIRVNVATQDELVNDLAVGLAVEDPAEQAQQELPT